MYNKQDGRFCQSYLQKPSRQSSPSLKDRDKDLKRNCDFKYKPISPQREIRLLAVDPSDSVISEKSKYRLQIEKVDKLPDTEYIALSYFWGEARTDEDIHHIIVEGKQFWVRTCLWNFFQTAREFALKSPIYIDAICLDQQNLEERGPQVQIMEKVYSFADQTHVWLDCPPEQQFENLQMLVRDLTSGTTHNSWDTRSFIGLSYLCSTSYWRRLWVVQEILLSKAVEIHCGPFTFSWDALLALTKPALPTSISRVDENLTWWDAWSFTQPEDYSCQLEQDKQVIHGWQFALRLFHCRQKWPSNHAEGALQTPDLPFHQAISAFQLQQCRYQRDKIFALIGLLDHEGRSMITPSYVDTLHQVFLDAAAAGLISLWKERVPREKEITLTNVNRDFCENLHVLLAMDNEPVRTRITRTLMSLHFANLHIGNQQEHGGSQGVSIAPMLQKGQFNAFRPDSEEHKLFSESVLQGLISCGYPELAQENNLAAEFVSAARKNQSKVIEYLLSVGCNVNVIHNGTTAVREALTYEHRDLVERLLEIGAKPDMDGGETILMTLARLGRLEMFKIVLGRTNSPLHLEATHGDDTVLGKATDRRRFKMLGLLRQHGADPDHPCAGATPLFRAAARGDKNVVRVLRIHNADLEKPCSGMSPLFIAARNNEYGAVRTLVMLGADLESDCGGATALYDAVRRDSIKMVVLLVELGANPYARVGGVPALIVARNQGFLDVAKLLHSHYTIREFYAWLIVRLYIIGGPLLALAQWCKQGNHYSQSGPQTRQ
jgi:ankyrin repeat protein